MTTHVEDVTTHVGLVIDGDVEAGGAGTYPVTNPARPAEVVLEAPSTSPEQLDRAVAAARRAQPAWAARAMEDRAATVLAAAEAGVASVEAHDLARLLTREHGKTHLEAIFDTATMGGMAAAFAPVVADALAGRVAERRGDPGRVGAPRRGGGDPPVQLARLGDGQQDPPGAAGGRHRRREGPADVPGHRAAGGGGHGRGAARRAC